MRSLASAALLARMAEKGMAIVSQNELRCDRCGAPVPVAEWSLHRAQLCPGPKTDGGQQ